MSWQDKSWNHYNYNLMIMHDSDGDCIKALHFYKTKDETEWKMASISPYEFDSRVLEWYIQCIEAGADPKGPYVRNINGRSMYSNWDKKSIQDYLIKYVIPKRKGKMK